MRKFDYSFLKRISVPADIMNYATSIYEMKAKAELRRSDFAEVFSAMESVAKIQSVKSSNAIEIRSFFFKGFGLIKNMVF